MVGIKKVFMKKKFSLIYAIVMLLFSLPSFSQVKTSKPRTIVTTDGEIDDVNSYIRLLLYSNEFNIEGLVYSSSMWHYKGDGKGTKFISEMEMTKKMYGEKNRPAMARCNMDAGPDRCV